MRSDEGITDINYSRDDDVMCGVRRPLCGLWYACNLHTLKHPCKNVSSSHIQSLPYSSLHNKSHTAAHSLSPTLPLELLLC